MGADREPAATAKIVDRADIQTVNVDLCGEGLQLQLQVSIRLRDLRGINACRVRSEWQRSRDEDSPLWAREQLIEAWGVCARRRDVEIRSRSRDRIGNRH